MLRVDVQFVTQAVLAECLFGCSDFLRKSILRAYATQKVSERENQPYSCFRVKHYKATTHRRLGNMKIVSYEAHLVPDPTLFSTIPRDLSPSQEPLYQERECRRYVWPSNSYLVSKLLVSCNDFSDTRYASREIELVYENYRLIINPNLDIYTIQFKRPKKSSLIYLPHTMTMEAMYQSEEGPVHQFPVALLVGSGEVLGLATFIDSPGVSVKTTYLRYKESVVLYQRIEADDYTRSYPFIVELEFGDKQQQDEAAAKLYFETCWRLNAALPGRLSDDYSTLPADFKPVLIENMSKDGVVALPKLDGYPATLKFYPKHFVVSNITACKSYSHRIPPEIYYVLKDYAFLVESELYQTQTHGKPNAMAIIDLQTASAFNPKERYKILQDLKHKFQVLLSQYNIFVNSEEWFKPLIVDRVTPFSQVYTEPITLQDDKIYEVLLDEKGNVDTVVRERRDKLRPNFGT